MTHPCLTEILLMGRKESYQTKKTVSIGPYEYTLFLFLATLCILSFESRIAPDLDQLAKYFYTVYPYH